MTTRPIVSLLLLTLAFVGANAQNVTVFTDGPFHDYKGVHIGMTAEEARKVLGKFGSNKGEMADFYTVSAHEIAELYYDSNQEVFGITLTYLDATAPEPKSVLGMNADRKKDGSLYKLVRFPKSGYYIIYRRTADDLATTQVTIQKIQ